MKPAYQRIAAKNSHQSRKSLIEKSIIQSSVQFCTLLGRVDVVAKEVGVSTGNFQLGEKLMKNLIGSIDNVSNVVNCRIQGDQYSLSAPCSTSNDGVLNPVIISIISSGFSVETNFNGPVECSSSQGGGDTTAQPSSSLTGTTQDGDRGSSSDSNRDGDGDGDGIPDSSDNCTHNSNPRCFKEEGTR